MPELYKTLLDGLYYDVIAANLARIHPEWQALTLLVSFVVAGLVWVVLLLAKTEAAALSKAFGVGALCFVFLLGLTMPPPAFYWSAPLVSLPILVGLVWAIGAKLGKRRDVHEQEKQPIPTQEHEAQPTYSALLSKLKSPQPIVLDASSADLAPRSGGPVGGGWSYGGHGGRPGVAAGPSKRPAAAQQQPTKEQLQQPEQPRDPVAGADQALQNYLEFRN